MRRFISVFHFLISSKQFFYTQIKCWESPEALSVNNKEKFNPGFIYFFRRSWSVPRANSNESNNSNKEKVGTRNSPSIDNRVSNSGITPTTYLPLTTYHLPPTTYHLPPITYHQPPTTYHLPPTTYHLPPTTYHLPPTTYHLPPTTYHLPTTTYHLPPKLECWTGDVDLSLESGQLFLWTVHWSICPQMNDILLYDIYDSVM